MVNVCKWFSYWPKWSCMLGHVHRLFPLVRPTCIVAMTKQRCVGTTGTRTWHTKTDITYLLWKISIFLNVFGIRSAAGRIQWHTIEHQISITLFVHRELPTNHLELCCFPFCMAQIFIQENCCWGMKKSEMDCISMQRNYLNTSRITNALHKLMNECPNFVCETKSKPVYIMIYSKISNSYQTNKQPTNHPANRWLSLAVRNAATTENV